MALLAYLTATVWKCNEVTRREVALKEGRSRRMCWVLGAGALAHVATALLLYQQDLWKHLALMPAGGHDVRALPPMHALRCYACLSRSRRVCCCCPPAHGQEQDVQEVLMAVRTFAGPGEHSS